MLTGRRAGQWKAHVVRSLMLLAVMLSVMVSAMWGVRDARAGDWPMWRHDAQRSAATPEQLPDTLHLQWVREYPQLEPAWPDQAALGFLTFDVSYKPVVMGKRMFVGSSLNCRLTALDTETGEEVWRFYADGPIRFAPVCWKDKVYFASDDGNLYCLNAADGSLKWRYQGGADGRKIIGNERLVSLWPARGGPVLADGTVYFGASVWPFVGTFLHAVDAETGKAVWVNSGLTDFRPGFSFQGSGLLVRPGFHGSVPQGYLTVADHRLAVPQGRNVTQLFDRKTGELIFHEIYGMHITYDPSDQWFALTAGRNVFSGPMGSRGVNIDTGAMAGGNPLGRSITAEKAVYQVSSGGVAAKDPTSYGALWQFKFTAAAAPTCPGSYIKAGDNLYVPGAGGQVLIVKDVDTDKRALAVGPKLPGGQVWDMLAADGKLFVVTRDGKIACYGGKAGEAKTHAYKPAALEAADDRVADILKTTGQREGYCLVMGLKDGKLAKALLKGSKLNVIAVDRDEKVVSALRREVDEAGLYGPRFSAHAGDPLAFGFPQYLFNLIVSETTGAAVLGDDAAGKEMMRILRPYGGTICLSKGGGGYELAVKKGAPEGAADWTHNNADAGNGMMGFDKLVKPPLGVLWFGGPPNTPMLPRHGRGPAPAVAAGRMFVEGIHLLRAIDIYTGRLLWEHPFPNLGAFYNTGAKQMGTHETGPNYASAADGVYVITPEKCVELNPATGELVKEFPLPQGVEKDSLWATVRVEGALLVATIRPIDTKREFAVNARVGAGGLWLAGYNRATGECLWSKKATYGWRSNGVALAKGKVFCIDGLAPAEMDQAKRRGMDITARTCMYGFDGATGKELWKVDEDIFGTWLGYSADHNVLVQGGAGGNDATALAVHKAADGSRVWRCPATAKVPPDPKDPAFGGPPMLHHDVIIPQLGQVIGLMDGKLRTRKEPLTGRDVPWTSAPQGCGYTHGGEFLMFHRAWSSGGYTEIKNAPRIVGLGGFRSGCTANMVPAGGVVTAPEYTKECGCQFQNKTSVGLIHMPDAENWSFDMGSPPAEGRIVGLGLNFGAPGDRVSDEGTVWLDCPDVGGPSQQVAVELAPSKDGARRDWLGNWRGGLVRTKVFAGQVFYHHNALIKGGPLPWVTASGLSGVAGVKVGLFYPAGAKDAASYTVRLYFAEPEPDAKAGDRVFSVKLQGAPVLADFDIVREAGGPRRGVVKEFKKVKVVDSLAVEFDAKAGVPVICGLEVIKD